MEQGYPPTLKHGQYEFVKYLGEGGEGVILQYRNTVTREILVVKM